jgi:hypothetical protein
VNDSGANEKLTITDERDCSDSERDENPDELFPNFAIHGEPFDIFCATCGTGNIQQTEKHEYDYKSAGDPIYALQYGGGSSHFMALRKG